MSICITFTCHAFVLYLHAGKKCVWVKTLPLMHELELVVQGRADLSGDLPH